MELWLVAIWVTLFAPVLGIFAFVGVTHLWWLLYHWYKGQTPPPLGLRYYLREGWAIAASQFWWNLTDRMWPVPQPETVQGRPVLCVHGYTQTRTNWRALRRFLASIGRPHDALTMGRPPNAIEHYSVRLENAMRHWIHQSEDGIDLVCHSMGGIVARHTLHQHPELAKQIRCIVTLGSPHRGTAMSRLPWLPSGRETHQMARRSGWLQELPSFEELAPQARVTTVSTDTDLIVYPQDTSHLPGTRRVHMTDLGHLGMLVYDEAVEVVIEALTIETMAAELPEVG